MSTPLITIPFRDHLSLQRVCEELHDSLFDLDAAVFDPAGGTWHGGFIRPLADPLQTERERRSFLRVRYRFPLLETVLRFDRVRTCKVKDKAQIGTYMFNRVRRSKKGWILEFCESMQIEFESDIEPTGELRDERILERLGYCDVFFGIIESGFYLE